MKRLVTSSEMSALDRFASESLGLSVSILMENAGNALAREAMALSPGGGTFLVICGPGNNGGDGLVAARKLVEYGRSVRVELTSESLKGEPKRKLDALIAAGTKPSHIPASAQVGGDDVVIDAIFGTGLSRAPQGAHADAIERILSWRKAGAKVLAADIPSGVHSDAGTAFSPHVRADVTVSFAFLKVGQMLEPGASLSGRLTVADIGIPASALATLPEPSIQLIEEPDARDRVPRRDANSHKGTYGHVLIVAGSRGKTGAATLCGAAALRSGVGLATVAARLDALAAIMQPVPELMGAELPGTGSLGLTDLERLLAVAEGKEALVVGPGIPRGPETGKLLNAWLSQSSSPSAIDADGLNALAENPKIVERAKGPLLLTPHPGEASRLLSQSTAEVQADRIAAARALAVKARAVVILKGARSLIANPDGRVYVNPTGNPGLAKGGTGDVLAGMCGAFLAQGLRVEDAALVATYAHGLSADLQAKETGQLGLMASDVIRGLGKVWTRWGR